MAEPAVEGPATLASEIQKVSEELSYPGTNTVFRVLQQRGVRVTREQVEQHVRGQAERQLVGANARPLRGKVGAPRKNARWDVDNIVYVAQPSDKVENILIAQDIFTRRIMARPLPRRFKDKIIEELRKLFEEHGKPLELHADLEFADDKIKKFLEEQDVVFRPKTKGDHVHTATLDNAIGNLRKALSREMIANNTKEWAPLLPKAANALNNQPREPLLGNSAKEAWSQDDKTLEFQLRQKAAQDRETNEVEAEKRKGKLEELGGFRTIETEIDKRFKRGYKVVQSGEVHEVKEVTQGRVEDAKGNEYENRLAYPVPKSSRSVEVPELSRRGSAASAASKQARLERYIAPIKARLERLGGKEKTWTLAKYMREDLGMDIRGTLTQNLRLMGFKTYLDSNNESWAALPGDE